jgi:hypothetical protein
MCLREALPSLVNRLECAIAYSKPKLAFHTPSGTGQVRGTNWGQKRSASSTGKLSTKFGPEEQKMAPVRTNRGMRKGWRNFVSTARGA